MSDCRVIPYVGKEPYIFVSYCHKDCSAVYPFLDKMSDSGYRIWYDPGIEPGDEWAETIAKHLGAAKMCLAVISENAVSSHNCRREINFAVLHDVEVLPVFIENTVLTPGMEMQLSSNQYIAKYKFANDDDFLAQLYSVATLAKCKGAAVPQKRLVSHIIIHTPEDKPVSISKSKFTVGREDSDKPSDYMYIENSRQDSRRHFTLTIKAEKCFITDNNSKNGTRLNDLLLSPNMETELQHGDVIRLRVATFVYNKQESESK